MHPRSLFTTAAVVLSALGCRGNDSPTEPATTALPEGSAAAAIAFWQLNAGQDRTCGVTTDNQAYCWGVNFEGELGDGTGTPRSRPQAVVGGLRFRQVSAGGYEHTCGVTTDYRAYCWGDNSFGQLGDGTTAVQRVPVAVAGGHRFRQIDTGSFFSCGVSYPDNRAYCWGSNGQGQLGDGTINTVRLVPVLVGGGHQFRQVSAGEWHTCGVTTEDRVFCWGNNRNGQIGDSTTAPERLTPTQVAGGRRFRQVDAGAFYACAVTLADKAFCWGDNETGQLGTGKTYKWSLWPRAVFGGIAFERVTAGYRHTCGETTNDRLYCWGFNYSGEVGDGTTVLRRSPVPVVGGLYFAQASAGSEHTCGKTAAGVGYCWGDNSWAQLGDGTTTDRLRPTRVLGPL